jgi:serralysin
LQGNAGANVLNGGAGADAMHGFGGSDTFHVDSAGDVVVEGAGGGNDTVLASVSYTLAAGSEIELLATTNAAGTGAINLTGNALAQTIHGNAGSNVLNGGAGSDVLNGGAGADTMHGLGGNDTFDVDNAGDVVQELAGGGSDRVLTSVSYALASGSEIEVLTTTNAAGTGAINLTGNAYAQTMHGNAGANVLNGGGGADTMHGLGGHDTFHVDNAGDVVVEGAGGGSDTVLASVSHALAAGSEIELLATTNAAGTGAINLTGNAFAQILQGNAGANVLNGGAGADAMHGFGGNDTFHVDNAGDKVHESAGGGSDRVLASVSYGLAAGSEIELLASTNAAGTGAINLTGNAFAQTLQGNAGANVLNGGAGADAMHGFGGSDVFYVDSAGDTVHELAGGGSDRVLTSVSYTLAAGSEIEVLTTTNLAGRGAINLTGNAFAQTIHGNAGANVLNGSGGADTLRGFAGDDTFLFNTAVTGPVTILDFSTVNDRFALDDLVFTALGGPGALDAGAFHTGAAAAGADDRIVYNSVTGTLSYDADGNADGAAVEFALLGTGLALNSADFLVV